jgi:hypothetical protein
MPSEIAIGHPNPRAMHSFTSAQLRSECSVSSLPSCGYCFEKEKLPSANMEKLVPVGNSVASKLKGALLYTPQRPCAESELFLTQVCVRPSKRRHCKAWTSIII